MIDQGDGRFADFLRLGRCPKCEVVLIKRSDDGLECECPSCGLKIGEVRAKDADDEQT